MSVKGKLAQDIIEELALGRKVIQSYGAEEEENSTWKGALKSIRMPTPIAPPNAVWSLSQ